MRRIRTNRVGRRAGKAEQPPPARRRSSRNWRWRRTASAKETVQILKFHGIYQQSDRDARKTRRTGPLGSMVRVGVAGGVLTPEQYLCPGPPGGRSRRREPAGHLAAGHPVPPRAEDAAEAADSPAEREPAHARWRHAATWCATWSAARRRWRRLAGRDAESSAGTLAEPQAGNARLLRNLDKRRESRRRPAGAR